MLNRDSLPSPETSCNGNHRARRHARQQSANQVAQFILPVIGDAEIVERVCFSALNLLMTCACCRRPLNSTSPSRCRCHASRCKRSGHAGSCAA